MQLYLFANSTTFGCLERRARARGAYASMMIECCWQKDVMGTWVLKGCTSIWFIAGRSVGFESMSSWSWREVSCRDSFFLYLKRGDEDLHVELRSYCETKFRGQCIASHSFINTQTHQDIKRERIQESRRRNINVLSLPTTRRNVPR